ncbi:MAG: hypothetical protein C0467_24615 [Planctomycetaceae bacterium]|nr:hypothetical protein [Planctomycetaceae bacterium]
MTNSRPKPKAWVSRVPTADAVLRESVVRVTSNKPGTWGYVLAGVRESRHWSQEQLAMATSVSVSALVFLSLCRSPRQGHLEDDLVGVADRMGIPTAALWFMLDLATEAKAVNCRTANEGAA